MRVLFHLLDSGVGGAQRVAADIAVELVRRGHEVGVVVPVDGPSLAPFRDLGATVHLLDAGTLRRPLAMVRLARVARGYDLLYSHTSAPGQIVGGLAASTARKQHLVHHHTYPYFSTRPAIRAGQTLLYRLALRPARFVAVASHVADGLVSLGIARERIVVVPNGIAARAVAVTDNDPPLIGMLARLDPGKGILTFVAAAAALRGAARAAFVIGGQEGPFSEFSERLRAEVARAEVELVVPVDDGASFLSTLDVVAIPSEYEGSPLVLLEAMSLGKAIVASDIPGIREVLLPEAGMLVSVGDVDGLARALRELVARPDLRVELGLRARELAQRDHNLGEWARRLGDMIEGMAPPPRARA